MRITLRVLTRPMADRLPHIYRTLGMDYAERVLPSIVQVRPPRSVPSSPCQGACWKFHAVLSRKISPQCLVPHVLLPSSRTLFLFSTVHIIPVSFSSACCRALCCRKR